MCDAMTGQAIEDIVIEKVNAQEMFTAFDITMELKRRNFREPHHEVKKTVHAFFEGGGMGADYDRQVHDIGAPIPPFVYHPRGQDVKQYGKPAKNKPAPVAPIPAGPSISVGGVACSPKPAKKSKTTRNTKSDEARADARGTVCLPAVLLQRAGFNPGNTAYVYPNPTDKRVVIAKDPRDVANLCNKTQCRKYTVDSHGNVRITRTSLSLAGIQAQNRGDKYKVATDGNVVKLAVS